MWFGVAASAVCAAWALAQGGGTEPDAPARVPTVKVREGTLERRLLLTGSLAGENAATLMTPRLRGSRTRGGGSDFRLTLTYLAAPGQRVKQGEMIAQFDSQSMRDRLRNLEAECAEEEAALRSLAASLKAQREAFDQRVRAARATMEQARLDLQTLPVRAAIDAELLRLAVAQAEAQHRALVSQIPILELSHQAQLKRAELEVREDESELRRAQMNVDRMTVRAPSAGLVVIRETVRNNEYGTIRVGDELRAGQPYIDLVAPGPMLVDAMVNQVDIRRLEIGQTAIVSPDAFPGLEQRAEIIALGTVAETSGMRASYVRELPVRLRIEEPDPRVLPGLTVRASVLINRVEGARLVSRTAVFRDAGSGKRYALVRSPEGWQRHDLTVGATNAFTAAILSGLEVGDEVAAVLPSD